MNAKLLPVIILGVAIGTLIALYVAGTVVQKKLSEQSTTGATGALLGLLNRN